MKHMQQLRSCAVRLERAVLLENHRKRPEHVIRSCKVVLERIQVPTENYRQGNETEPKDKKVDRRDAELEDCIVEIERMRYVDITISTPKPGWREIYYTLEAESSDGETKATSTTGNSRPLRFEEWHQETIQALPTTATTSEPPLIMTDNTTNRPRKKPLVLKLPEELSYVFNVNDIKNDLPSILSVITGNKMSLLVLDAYMTLLLQKFRTLGRHFSSNENRPQIKRRKSSRIPGPGANNFQYLPVFYFPVYKSDINDENCLCPSEVDNLRPSYAVVPALEDNTILIAPQFALDHFYLAIYDFSARIIHVFDSSWKFVPSAVRLQQVQTVLKQLLQESTSRNRQDCWEQWYVNVLHKSVQQTDEFSCGCYVIHYTENILRGKIMEEACTNKLNNKRLVEIRRNIAKELLSTTKAGSEILEAITEQE